MMLFFIHLFRRDEFFCKDTENIHINKHFIFCLIKLPPPNFNKCLDIKLSRSKRKPLIHKHKLFPHSSLRKRGISQGTKNGMC